MGWSFAIGFIAGAATAGGLMMFLIYLRVEYWYR